VDGSVTRKYPALGDFEILFGAFNVISHNVFRVLANTKFQILVPIDLIASFLTKDRSPKA
jgi:hypothetical protein